MPISGSYQAMGGVRYGSVQTVVLEPNYKTCLKSRLWPNKYTCPQSRNSWCNEEQQKYGYFMICDLKTIVACLLPSSLNSNTMNLPNPADKKTSSITKPLGFNSRSRLRQPLIAAAPGLICARSLTQMTQMHLLCNTLHQKSCWMRAGYFLDTKTTPSNQVEYTSSTHPAESTLGGQATLRMGYSLSLWFACWVC